MVSVDAALVAECAGFRVRVDAEGSLIVCRLAGDRTGAVFALIRRARQMVATLRAISPLLVRAGVRLDVRAGNRAIICAGSGVKQDAVARFLRVPAARVGR